MAVPLPHPRLGGPSGDQQPTGGRPTLDGRESLERGRRLGGRQRGGVEVVDHPDQLTLDPSQHFEHAFEHTTEV